MQLWNRVDKKILEKNLLESTEERITLSFYKYAKIENPESWRDELYLKWNELGVLGRIYVAKEGINGQLSVPQQQHDNFKQHLYSYPFLNGIRLNYAIDDDGKSFAKLKILVRSKIVADGLNDDTFDSSDCGIHLNAKDFNEITNDENTIVVDMRNHYESEIGHFENAITPDVDTFREQLPLVVDLLKDKKDKNIVMYCNRGIRCEKASAWMKHNGFEHVYQLNGGIIEYARQIQEQGLENKFKGKNFVFDRRLGEKYRMKLSQNAISAENLPIRIRTAKMKVATYYLYNVKHVLKFIMAAAAMNVKRFPYCLKKNKNRCAKASILEEKYLKKDVVNS